MKTATKRRCLPRTKGLSVPLTFAEAPQTPALRLEVRCEVASPAQEAELRRLACLQRLAHLRGRLEAVRHLCQCLCEQAQEILC